MQCTALWALSNWTKFWIEKSINYWFSENNRFGSRLLFSWGSRMCVGTDLYTNLPVCLYEKKMCSLEWRIKECFIKAGWGNLPWCKNIFHWDFLLNLGAQKQALFFFTFFFNRHGSGLTNGSHKLEAIIYFLFHLPAKMSDPVGVATSALRQIQPKAKTACNKTCNFPPIDKRNNCHLDHYTILFRVWSNEL